MRQNFPNGIRLFILTIIFFTHSGGLSCEILNCCEILNECHGKQNVPPLRNKMTKLQNFHCLQWEFLHFAIFLKRGCFRLFVLLSSSLRISSGGHGHWWVCCTPTFLLVHLSTWLWCKCTIHFISVSTVWQIGQDNVPQEPFYYN